VVYRSPRARFFWLPSRWDLEGMVGQKNTFITLLGQFNSVYLGICGMNGVRAAYDAASHISTVARLLNWT
jgi:hypothetical protein